MTFFTSDHKASYPETKNRRRHTQGMAGNTIKTLYQNDGKISETAIQLANRFILLEVIRSNQKNTPKGNRD
jgi:hypothetical protein